MAAPEFSQAQAVARGAACGLPHLTFSGQGAISASGGAGQGNIGGGGGGGRVAIYSGTNVFPA